MKSGAFGPPVSKHLLGRIVTEERISPGVWWVEQECWCTETPHTVAYMVGTPTEYCDPPQGEK